MTNQGDGWNSDWIDPTTEKPKNHTVEQILAEFEQQVPKPERFYHTQLDYKDWINLKGWLEDTLTQHHQEMSHTNNKEVERIAEQYLKEFPPMPEDLIGCVFNKEAVDEFNRARLRSTDWLRITLHQELQKARAEMLHKLHLCAIGKYEGDALENVKAQIAEYQSELDQPNNK